MLKGPDATPVFLDVGVTGTPTPLPSAAGWFVEITNPSTGAVVVDRGAGTPTYTLPGMDKVFHVCANADELRVSTGAAGGGAVQAEVWGQRPWGNEARPRTTRFQEVLFAVARHMGVVPLRNFQQNLADAIAGYLSERHREGWEAYEWPEVCPVVMRKWARDWDAERTYGKWEVVWDWRTWAYYRSLGDGNADNPVSDSDWWEVATIRERLVRLEEEGEEPIGGPLEAWMDDPATWWRPRSVGFALTARGILFRSEPWGGPNVVWIKHRGLSPEFTATPWSAGTAYAAGSVVYWTDGDCWRARVGTVAGEQPPVPGAPVSGSKWVRQPFLRVLRPWAEFAAYSDAMEEAGETDKATAALNKAEDKLEKAMEVINTQEGQTGRFGVRVR